MRSGEWIGSTANNQFSARAAGGFRFRTNSTLSTGCNLPAGDQILIGGRVAVRYPGPGLCDPLQASDEEVVAVTVSPQRVDLVITCTRNANTAARAAVAAMFDSIRWRTP